MGAWHAACARSEVRRSWILICIGGFLLVLFLAASGAYVQVRWLGPRPPDASEWFPMRLGDRWTYTDERGGGDIVFEVVRRTERDKIPLFVVERRIGPETLTFILAAAQNGVWIYETTKGVFDPPFMEFRLPPAGGDRWEHSGRFGDRPVGFEMSVSRIGGDEFEVIESSQTSHTAFRLRRGVGVTKLDGKAFDPHSASARYQSWKLRDFSRR